MTSAECIELIERECRENTPPDAVYILELIRAYRGSNKEEPTWKELKQSRSI